MIVKPVALSLVLPYSEGFVLQSRNIPNIPELFEPVNLEVKLTLSNDQLSQIEKDTRDQASGGIFLATGLAKLEHQ